jgi:uncharacterized membrane protein YdbT with pleckstrin-like domain
MPEQHVDRFRTSTGRWLVGSAAGLGTIGLGVAGLVAGVATGQPLFLILTAMTFVIILLRWLQGLSTLYEVTDQRLIVCRGLVMKTVDEIELYRIKDVRLDFSLLGQLADIGTVTLTSTDRTTGDTAFVLPDVPHARERREGLRGLVERARQKRGVREIDMEGDVRPAG